MNSFPLRVLGLLAVFALASCGVRRHPVHEVTVVESTPGPEVVVVERPPAARVEVVPVAPSPNHVWVGGYWMRHGSTWDWVGGTYHLRPRPAAVWVPGHWDARPRGWVWVPGHWR